MRTAAELLFVYIYRGLYEEVNGHWLKSLINTLNLSGWLKVLEYLQLKVTQLAWIVIKRSIVSFSLFWLTVQKPESDRIGNGSSHKYLKTIFWHLINGESTKYDIVSTFINRHLDFGTDSLLTFARIKFHNYVNLFNKFRYWLRFSYYIRLEVISRKKSRITDQTPDCEWEWQRKVIYECVYAVYFSTFGHSIHFWPMPVSFFGFLSEKSFFFLFSIGMQHWAELCCVVLLYSSDVSVCAIDTCQMNFDRNINHWRVASFST